MRFAKWITLFAASMQSAQAVSLPGLNGGRALYLPLVIREATAQGIPPELADAVAMVETGYRPDAIGSSGEIGLMQVMPATARQLGFHGTAAELADPATNIALGVRYLARAWMLGGGDVCRSLMKYRAGLGQELMTPLSTGYCARAIGWLASTGSRLADATLPDGSAALPAPKSDPYVIAIVPALAEQALRHGPTTQRPPVLAAQKRTIAGLNLAQAELRSSHQRSAMQQRRTGSFEKSVPNVQAAVQASLDRADP